MRKGFTLIELLGVIIIISLLLLIIVPIVTSNIKEGKDTALQTQEENVLIAGRNWASDNKDRLPLNDGDSIKVTLKELLEGGYIESGLVNPKTGDSLDYENAWVTITKKGNTYTYEYSFPSSSKDEYTLTYNYSENGGSSSTKESVTVKYGDDVDLSPTAVKSGWTFVGWNSKKNSTSALNKYTMPRKNTDIYAIFRKTINIKYSKDGGIKSISQTKASCNIYNKNTTCTVTLPEITPTDKYNVLGWYIKGTETKVGDSKGTYSVSDDIELEANSDIFDKIAPTCTITPYGTKGLNDWYVSDVVLNLTYKDDAEGVGVASYGISTSDSEIYNQTNSITVNEDTKGVTYYGYVKDKAGNVGKCSVKFKRDATAPSDIVITNNPGCVTSPKTITPKLSVTEKTSGVSKWQYGYSTTSMNDYKDSAKTDFTPTAFSAVRNQLAYFRVYDNAGNASKFASTNICINAAQTCTVEYYNKRYCYDYFGSSCYSGNTLKDACKGKAYVCKGNNTDCVSATGSACGVMGGTYFYFKKCS